MLYVIARKRKDRLKWAAIFTSPFEWRARLHWNALHFYRGYEYRMAKTQRKEPNVVDMLYLRKD